MDRFELPKMDKTNKYKASEFSTKSSNIFPSQCQMCDGRTITAKAAMASVTSVPKTKDQYIFELCENGKTNSSILHE